MGAEIDENLETAKFDTSQAVVSRMQELDLRMGVLLEKIKLFSSDPSQWTLIKSSSAVANSGAAQASSSTSPATTSPATATTSSSSSSTAEELLTAARQHILYNWSKILEESKQKLLVKQPKNEKASSPQALTLTDLEKLCLSSSEWKSIPRAASQYFFDAFRDSIMSEVGPLLPADFIQKNKMYPKMRSSAVQNELQENSGGGNGNEKDSSFTVSNNNGNNKSKKKEVEEPKQKFVRNLSSTSFFSCCTSIDANEMYQRAVSEYNSSFISSLLKPAEKDLVILGDGNNQNPSSSAKIGEVIIWRGNVVLEAAKQNWIPPTVVRDVAISLLQGFLLQFGNKDLEQNVSSSSSSSLEKQFNQLIAGFNRLPAASRTSGNSTVTFLPVVPAEENNNDNNNNNNSQFDDLWVLFDSFLHVMATAHFHCDAIYQRHFPKNLVTASSKMSSCVKKLIWSTRKSIFSKCVNLWSTNYATSVIDNFIDEASTHSMIVITSSSSSTDVDSSSHVIEDEPVQPFRPVREEVAMELNKFLDGFVERYRELVGTVVKITTATQQNHTNNNNTSGKPSPSPCCGYCCRGLFQSISKIVPEANDVVLTKSLQNRLRQKLIVAFVCTEKDREVVKALLSEVAEKIWKFTVGGDLASDEKKFEQDGANNNNNNNDTSILSATNNNNNNNNNNHNDDGDASFAEHGGGMFSPTEGRGSNNNNDKPSSSPTTTAAANKTTRFEKIDSRYESRFPGKKSLESMAELIDNAKNRIIWHAAAEMTRITDAISEMVVQKKCPRALAVFNNTFVRQCAQAAQPHLVMQAQSLLSAKELSRISERLCDVGVNAGGPNLRGFSRQDAKIIEISRTLEQMDSLLKRFPKEALQTINPEFDNITKKDGGGGGVDDDEDGDDNQNNKTDQQQQDNSDDLAWNQQNNNSAVMGRNNSNNNMDDMQKLFAEMGKVLPLYRMKQSWNVYDQMVKNN